MRTLGAHCTNAFAFLALATDGAVIDASPYRVGAAKSLDEATGFEETFDSFIGAIREVAPDEIRLLLPESTAKANHSSWRPRIELETLLRMAAAKLNLPLASVARPTARTRLGLPKAGKFEKVALSAIDPVGPYWQAGRALAAAAALSAVRAG